MSRDEYLQGMLRDLGSVYYQTLEGEATAADVARAVESVRLHQERMKNLGYDEPRAGSHESTRGKTAVPASRVPPRQGIWRVIDVMATDVVTIDKHATYKQVARLLAENDLTAVPVVSSGGRVLGMVSEADVLRREEKSFSRLSAGLPRRSHHERLQAEALTAAELMSSPAVTIHPDAPLGAAARLMNGHHIRRLPVVNPAGELLGMVSRRDLLRVFLRPDTEIAGDVADALGRALTAGPVRVAVTVADGVVTLTGEVQKADMIAEAVRAASEVNGVVAVTSKLAASSALETTG
jgi:CBS domain-containing protein